MASISTEKALTCDHGAGRFAVDVWELRSFRGLRPEPLGKQVLIVWMRIVAFTNHSDIFSKSTIAASLLIVASESGVCPCASTLG